MSDAKAALARVGRLEGVRVQDVWPGEATDFTPWLARNLDDLALALSLDLDLDLVETEKAVGPFKADMLLRTVEGEAVVVENMYGTSDHDHLGKLLTYAAGLDATHAILIAERLRPEHRTMLRWLNENSSDPMHYFGVEIKAWRIGESVAAPQFAVVVQPDDWQRQVRSSVSGELRDIQQLYQAFWSEFLPAFHQAHAGWSRANTPGKDNWMNFPAGRTQVSYGANYNYAPCRNAAPSFRVEVYIDGKNREQASSRFDALHQNKEHIEAEYGGSLEWDPLPGARACRIASYYAQDAQVTEREQWPQVREWAVEHLGKLRSAFAPYIANLD